MAIQLVKLIIFLSILYSTSTLAENSEIWRQKIEESINSKHLEYRLVFGQAEIVNDESSAIEAAKTIARAEMAKTFVLKIKTSSTQESSYQQTNTKSDSKKIFMNTSTLESTDEINLVGLDLSKFNIDKEHMTVQVAAIINLNDFEKYLISNSAKTLASISEKTKLMQCKNIEDLKSIRIILKTIYKMEKTEEILMSFSKESFNLNKLKNETESIAKSCHQNFSFNLSQIPDELKPDFIKIIQNAGYSIATNKKQKNELSIVVKKEISPPENKFNQFIVTAKGEITITLAQQIIANWKGLTIKQMAPDQETAKTKIGIRVTDAINNGLTSIFEEQL